jgi:hypothetical protein
VVGEDLIASASKLDATRDEIVDLLERSGVGLGFSRP